MFESQKLELEINFYENLQQTLNCIENQHLYGQLTQLKIWF